MKKDQNVYLRNILDKANEAILYCNGLSAADFLMDEKTQSAVIMKLIVIGEESKKVSEMIKKKIDVPWKLILGFRNMAVHEYLDLDLKQVWFTVNKDLPKLIKTIEKYLSPK